MPVQVKRQICRRNCFKCEKPLKGSQSGELKQEFREAPDGATCWTTRGNWGSAVFDQSPGDRETMEISICDRCFKKHRKLMLAFTEVVTRGVELVQETLRESLARTLKKR
jgi:hypothetical protein